MLSGLATTIGMSFGGQASKDSNGEVSGGRVALPRASISVLCELHDTGWTLVHSIDGDGGPPVCRHTAQPGAGPAVYVCHSHRFPFGLRLR